jgi:cell filamentation protein
MYWLKMSRYEADDFCYPGTSVLINKLGIDNQAQLDAVEADLTAIRLVEVAEKPYTGNFDLQHLCHLHQCVFQDLYDWAGKIRTVDISKGNSRFANIQFIESHLNKELATVANVASLKSLSPESFIDVLTHLMSEMNAVHPFREGNGRINRLFCAQLAESVGYFIDYSLMDLVEYLEAMITSFHGDEAPLKRILLNITSKIESE